MTLTLKLFEIRLLLLESSRETVTVVEPDETPVTFSVALPVPGYELAQLISPSLSTVATPLFSDVF